MDEKTTNIRFFPTDIDYKIIEEKPVVFIYGRVNEGQQILILDKGFEPYFYILTKKGTEADVEKKILKIEVEKKGFFAKVERTERVKKKIMGEDIDVLKVFTNIPKAVPAIREVVREWDMIEECYEYDIHFVKRYIIDKQITPFSLVEVDGIPSTLKSRVPVIEAKNIKQHSDETLKEPRILAIDIESYNPKGKQISFEEFPIIMIALYGKNFKKVITWKRFSGAENYMDFAESEAELLEKFKEAVEHYKPDIITGYFSDAFDLPYIAARAKKYKVKLDLGLDYSDMEIRSTRTTTQSSFKGIVHLDVFKFVRKIVSRTLETDSYSLDAVSEELLGEKKLDVDMDKLWEVWDNHPDKIGEYCAYNLKDSVLAHKLCTKILPNIIELVKIVGLPLYDVTRMGFSQLVEWYLMRQAQSFNEIAPNKPGHDDIKGRLNQTLKGAFVFEPIPGLYKDIAIFDYRSLYPTIISAHNISPETLNCSCCKEKSAGKIIEDKQGKYYFCKHNKGFFSTMIKDLITRRMRVKEIIKKAKDKDKAFLEARSEGLKLLANSAYGYLAFYAARWYSIGCARAVTAYGRFYIHQVIDKAEEEGFKVIYSDTDSIFLLLEDKSIDEAHKFAERINQKLPDMMELEYEGTYPSGIFVSAKMGDYGAKKKYAVVDDKGEIKIKGFETIRRNWSPIAKEVQAEILNIILKQNDVEKAVDFVIGIVAELEKGQVDNDRLVIFTQLQKDIDDYENKGPHVKAAMRMVDKGIPVHPGTIIKYIVTKGKGKIGDRVRLPEELKEGEYDFEYYIKNQVIPGVESIFSVLGVDVKEFTADKKQSKLEGFFG